jgi:glycosyltransferase involved in cell wall biosynthesis
MEKELIISVIVPVYNGEAFVRRAVESVLCQMNGRIELILVDDGSTDCSGTICDGYAEKYPDVHVIHKKNGGTSSAKNMGIEAAKGRYLSFLDCDDFFASDTYSQIIPILLAYEPDCLDFGWKYVNAQGEVSENLHQCKKNVLMLQQELETVILPPLLNLRKDDAHFVYDFCWNKIFKTEIIKAFHVRFDEEKRTWEDRTFLLRHFIQHCRKQCFR